MSPERAILANKPQKSSGCPSLGKKEHCQPPPSHFYLKIPITSYPNI